MFLDLDWLLIGFAWDTGQSVGTKMASLRRPEFEIEWGKS
jgi:hypothetical protein